MKNLFPAGLKISDLVGRNGRSVASAARCLGVSDRTVYRWLAADDAPRAVLVALWAESPAGRAAIALDVGNELSIYRGLARSNDDRARASNARLLRLLGLADTGAANAPFFDLGADGLGPASINSAPLDFPISSEFVDAFFDVDTALQV